MVSTLTKKITTRLPFLNRTESDDTITSGLKKISGTNFNACLRLLKTQPEGLSQEEVEERLTVYGLNEIQHEKAPAWYSQLLHSFITPFNGVLIFVIIISLITDVWLADAADKDYKTVILLSTMILLSSLIRFWQEFRSNNAAERLKKMITTTALVLRKETGKKKLK